MWSVRLIIYFYFENKTTYNGLIIFTDGEGNIYSLTWEEIKGYHIDNGKNYEHFPKNCL